VLGVDPYVATSQGARYRRRAASSSPRAFIVRSEVDPSC
jgi:hypothetical protein